MPSAIRNVILRNGSPSLSQPIDTKKGTSDQLTRPPVSAAMPMRAPTIMPAPNVDVERSIAPRNDVFAAPMPPAIPSAIPPKSRDTDCLSRTGSVSARRMFATARPEGNVSRKRSTRIGRIEHPDAHAEHADA
jgi:hypothetical protein